jgi:hypothetical protein
MPSFHDYCSTITVNRMIVATQDTIMDKRRLKKPVCLYLLPNCLPKRRDGGRFPSEDCGVSLQAFICLPVITDHSHRFIGGVWFPFLGKTCQIRSIKILKGKLPMLFILLVYRHWHPLPFCIFVYYNLILLLNCYKTPINLMYPKIQSALPPECSVPGSVELLVI